MKLDRRSFLTTALAAVPILGLTRSALAFDTILSNERISVAAGNWYQVRFGVTGKMADVIGSFSVDRGDIYCFITDDNGVKDFNKGRAPSFIYSSGRTSGASFNIPAQRGWWTMIFNNQHERRAGKAVTASLMTNERYY